MFNVKTQAPCHLQLGDLLKICHPCPRYYDGIQLVQLPYINPYFNPIFFQLMQALITQLKPGAAVAQLDSSSAGKAQRKVSKVFDDTEIFTNCLYSYLGVVMLLTSYLHRPTV